MTLWGVLRPSEVFSLVLCGSKRFLIILKCSGVFCSVLRLSSRVLKCAQQF